ncbi:large conductance mechanosensitive channel protein MscL [Chitinophaga sp. sic0106]|uniref:large conductance mechanosensitive channel protein MscL n=1 Tax=Chitinophaga sp. sic0106 TaxID=2854785 RepID=UPI001C48E047|nr:large conductance mechanosensitive channel protein MscL [Chitinophaga sp. sic0106]MBV7533947.1 large conductance mechanosensitive channel protein MscL [Chitinophaga sp. sic0106]
MSFVKEFKEFALKGNVMDLAVGVIIGGAFGKIVTSLVDNLLMPIVSIFLNGVNFKDKFTVLSFSNTTDYKTLEEAKAAGVNVLAWGAFLQSVLDFVIIAFCIFMLVKFMNRLTRKKEEVPAPAELTTQEKLLIEIRDAIKSK